MRLGRYVVPPSHFQYDVVDMQVPSETIIRNARELEVKPRLDTFGFELRGQPTACTAFGDDMQVLRNYYPEVHSLVREATGASHVVLFDHALRSSPGVHLVQESAAPVERVHSDYTEESGRELVERVLQGGIYSSARKRVLKPAELAELSALKFAVINCWRSVDNEAPVAQAHLALCDKRSVQQTDTLYYEVLFPIYDDRNCENYGLQFNENQQWYYFPAMTNNECVLFKAFADTPGSPEFVFHSSFSETGPASALPARRSIEVRAIAFYGTDFLEGDVLQTKVKLKKGTVVRQHPAHE